jgi:hypothetical protein
MLDNDFKEKTGYYEILVQAMVLVLVEIKIKI